METETEIIKGHQVRYVWDSDGLKWYVIKDLAEACGMAVYRTITSRLKKTRPTWIRTSVIITGVKRKSKRKMTIYDARFLDSFCVLRRIKKAEGQLYCFTPKASDTVYKFGRTDDFDKRKNSYMGFNKPKRVLFVVDVKDQRAKEKVMLNFLNKSSEFFKREDLGDEWFESSLSPEKIKSAVFSVL